MSTNYDQRRTSGNTYRTTSGSRKRAAKKRKTTKVIIFAVELMVIAVMVGALYVVTRLAKPEQKGGIKVIELKQEALEIPQEVQENVAMKGYMNVALFGVDISREKTDEAGVVVDLLPAGTLRESGLLKGFRSDTIMIASINMDNGDIKLVSVFRDTFLNMGESYSKCNAAYSKGGAEQAVKMLNTNMDMDIENFVTVSYWALTEVIDALGGVYIDVSSDELKHLNNYGISIGKTMNTTYKPLAGPGYQLLTGMQAAAYCRIRYVGNDFARAARQREVIKAIEEQAKKSDVNKLLTAFENAQKDISTSLKNDDIVQLISHIADYKIVEEGEFPQEAYRTVKNMGAKGSCVVPTDLETNVKWLHKFLFDEDDYNVTNSVKEYSSYIKNFSAKYNN
ncbi:MAG: LCP family protein [Lachnospiraceae bacterium]|nr:LCP family protein [Lachnospiraceae bacterium]MBP5222317.1 LCP family protein [Lachnospiraceae bacterium]